MNHSNRTGWIVGFGVTIALVVFLVWLVTGCAALGGGSQGVGVVASASVAGIGRPTFLARYDGNTFVAWSGAAATAEVFGEATGFPLYGPTIVDAQTVVVHVRKPEFRWKGAPGDDMPLAARVLFRESEVVAWGLKFQGETP